MIFNEYIAADYLEVCRYSRDHEMPILDAETLMLGINHAEIGRILADKWALPLDLERAWCSITTPKRPEEIVDFTNIIHLADCMAHDADAGLWEEESRMAEWSGSRALAHLDDEGYDRITALCASAAEGEIEYLTIVK